uniref:Myb-like domain-containing protein n=1 Tax=Helicotheca tamesis TaxID=374047 RepID=A0A7S2N5L5_9STRA|mmetsp:Transcript_9905/g.13843  ORF Transcript_9905/g.13843 Transcript_9905/m.13843 type:complete len:200 (+) Transcript_9905:36-635(+)
MCQSSLMSGDNIDMNNGNNNHQESTNEEEQHERFIAALEQYGPQGTGWEWEHMASATGWTVDEVKLYAYRYMMALNETPSRHIDRSPSAANEGDNSSKGGHSPRQSGGDEKENEDDDWTFEERILFDTLLARHDGVNNSADVDYNPSVVSRWENISALLPNRTSLQVRQRYMKMCMEEREKRLQNGENADTERGGSAEL